MAEASAAEGSASAVPAEVVADAAHAVIPAAKHWSRRSVNQKQYRDRVNALRKEVKRRKGLVNGLADPAMELHASRVARLLLRRCSVADTAQIDAGEFPPVVSNDLVQGCKLTNLQYWKDLQDYMFSFNILLSLVAPKGAGGYIYMYIHMYMYIQIFIYKVYTYIHIDI